MKKFDFSNEFGNIDSGYITDAEKEWKNETSKHGFFFWQSAAIACVTLALCVIVFSNPDVQAAIRELALSISETLGFQKEIESYTKILNMSQTDQGITVTLKEAILDEGVLLADIHAEQAESSPDQRTEESESSASALSIDSILLAIDDVQTTINGKHLTPYGSSDYLPYTAEDLLDPDITLYETFFDQVLEFRFYTPEELGKNPVVHLVLNAYTDIFDQTPCASFVFDFTFPRAEILKQTVQKTLQNTSISTEKGTVMLNEIYANQLQSAISVRLPEELCDSYDLELRGTDSKGNNVRYELTDLLDYNGPHWNFKTGFWGAYEPETRENATTPKPALPDPDSAYVELQLYIKSNVFSLDDVDEMMDDASFSSELSETEFFEQDDTDPFGTETDFVLENSPVQDESASFDDSEESENDYGWERIGEKVRIPLN